jgi:hypothetical protein
MPESAVNPSTKCSMRHDKAWGGIKTGSVDRNANLMRTSSERDVNRRDVHAAANRRGGEDRHFALLPVRQLVGRFFDVPSRIEELHGSANRGERGYSCLQCLKWRRSREDKDADKSVRAPLCEICLLSCHFDRSFASRSSSYLFICFLSSMPRLLNLTLI